MWLKLYQSASIWLVLGLSRVPTHRSTVPQVQMGLRPMASRIAGRDERRCKRGERSAAGSHRMQA